MIGWIVKLISGWLPIGLNSEGARKTFGEWAGKIIWVVGIIAICLIVYHKFTQDTTTNNQEAEHIENYYNQPRAGTFGCATVKGLGRKVNGT